MTIKENIKKGLQGLVVVSILSVPISIPIITDLSKSPKDWYYVSNTQNFQEGGTKKIVSFDGNYKSEDILWKAAAHYCDAHVYRTLSFNDGSKATINIPLWENSSFFRRKILGPEIGEKYRLQGDYLERVK